MKKPEAVGAAHEKILDPKSIKFSRGAEGVLKMSARGGKVKAVRLRPIFPLSDPKVWIAVMTEADNSDKEEELGLLQELSGLEEASRVMVEEELARAFYLPVIRKVHKVESALGIMTWRVETDKGPRTFRVPDRDQIRYMALPGGGLRLLIRDDNNDRYLIENFNALDQDSRDALESEL